MAASQGREGISDRYRVISLTPSPRPGTGRQSPPPWGPRDLGAGMRTGYEDFIRHPKGIANKNMADAKNKETYPDRSYGHRHRFERKEENDWNLLALEN
jgi:hypothetical protein